MEENDIVDPTLLQAGRRLVVPTGRASTPATRTAAPDRVPLGFRAEARAIWPVRGRRATRFGQFKDGIRSTGIDIAGNLGEPVVAAKSGVVAFCSEGLEGWGKVVMLDHRDGMATWYAYNHELLVRPGQFVRQGARIARLGRTGRTDRPMLHFKVFRNESPIDPARFLP